MHPETRAKEQQLKEAGYDAQAAIARLRETAPEPPIAPVIPIQTSIPSSRDEPRLVLDMVQLHDLVHAATLIHLDRYPTMTRAKRHEHAGRIAREAELIAWASDYLQRGGDGG